MSTPKFRQLSRDELDTALDWAATEGWNPGLSDANAFWASDPDGFWAMEMEGQLIGTASTVVYEGSVAFVGLFIVSPEWRGRGYGGAFWKFFMERLDERLGENGGAGLDGVFAMQEYYRKGGFEFTHRNLRMGGVGRKGSVPPEVVNGKGEDFEELVKFDENFFGVNRHAFLKEWIRPEGVKLLAYRKAGALRGYGVIRPCRQGFKIGPLFAEGPEVADALFVGLSQQAVGKPLFLDVPEINDAALNLASQHGLEEQFGCARMVRGNYPKLPWTQVFGVTSLELG